jgi:hypothetical protein
VFQLPAGKAQVTIPAIIWTDSGGTFTLGWEILDTPFAFVDNDVALAVVPRLFVGVGDFRLSIQRLP